MIEPLPRAFFDRNAAEVAPEVIGCLLVRRDGDTLRVGRIVEAEAYVGEHDRACHARAGRTARTAPMYERPGHAYVYFIYGVHEMLNAVCGPGGHPSAVLIRAAEPIANLAHSGTGPGNVTKAFRIEMRHNRSDLCDPRSELFIAPRRPGDQPRLWQGPRVGVQYSGPRWMKARLRFCDRDSPHLSRPGPARR